MKTAISLPDKLYAEAEMTAHSMGIPRSQLYAKALEEFLHHHNQSNITDQLNKVYENISKTESQAISDLNMESVRDLTRNDTW